MACSLLAVTFSAADPDRLSQFWSQLLHRIPVRSPDGVLVPHSATQVGLSFVERAGADASDRRLHLHLTSADLADQKRIVHAARDLGATDLDVGQRPEEGHLVLADPEGNAFCVIEPDNRFLAGCGRLGEIACDGTRRVGQFWAAALGWSLVWDHEGETAVQSPEGGTKVAWGGPPVVAKNARNAQRFDLTVDVTAGLDALHSEVERLSELGATTAVEIETDVFELLDPDGNEFRLSPS